MIDIFSRFGERVFPERQILIRSRGEIINVTLPSMFQAAVAVAAMLSAAAVTYDFAAQRDRSAQVAVETLRSHLAAARQAAEAAETKLQQLEAERVARGDQLDAAEAGAQTAAQADVEALTARVQELENSVQVASHQSAENHSLYESTAAQLAQLTSEEKRLKAEKGKLESKLDELQEANDRASRNIATERALMRQKMADLEEKTKLPGKSLDRPAATDEAEADEPVTTTNKQVASAEGFDLAKFLAGFGVGMKEGSVGGPFVALDGGRDDLKTSSDAQKLLATLPLVPPLDHFQLESRFGVRSDPINGRPALHTGLDLSAPYRSPVYNTSSGTVVFAGYAGSYGKMVEIDHGMGIHTRYAHLNQITVNVGQKLEHRTRIGLLGSTGRSTGPHVHYEVTLNGVPQDPEKFLQAGESLAMTSTKAGS
jgi:murein DD-endopeptidase MepM/ murein hydrolase activator NlpD